MYKLNKSLYGLKQSSRNWNALLNDYLEEIGFERSQVHVCMYTKGKDRHKVILVVWVDDMIVTSADENLLDETKNLLKTKFKMKDLGLISNFLGINFEHGKDRMSLNQKTYVCKVLDRSKMRDCKRRTTPSEQKLYFQKMLNLLIPLVQVGFWKLDLCYNEH